jgi:alcohol dehydrogenase class IV
MPVVLAHNRSVIAERLAAAAAYIGVGQDYDAFIAHIMSMRAALGVPDTLTELGVTNPDLNALAKDALADPTAAANPVPLTLESVTRLYEQCL